MNQPFARFGGRLLALLAITAASTNAFGADSLVLIPTLTGDTSNEGRAITPDGRYAVGVSGTRGFLYSISSGIAMNVLSSDNAQATIASGVGYRTSGGNTELIIAGMSSGYVTEFMTSDGGATFAGKRRDTTFTYNVQPGYNSLGAALGSDVYYVTSSKNSGGNPVYLNQLSGAWLPSITYSSKGIPTVTANMNGVSASGRAVGWRGATTGSSTKQNYMLTWNGTATPGASFFPGLAGDNYGQAISVSANGNTVFGQSPITAGNVGANYGYKATFSGTTETSINALPLFGDESGSTSLQVPYGCTANGAFAVGMDYRTLEKAVLWVTADPDPSKWTIIDLTDLAASEGILDGFSRLNRAYSVGQDSSGGLVITGTGSWSPDEGVTPYVTRAFIMVVPEPMAVTLFAVGGLLALAFRRRQ